MQSRAFFSLIGAGCLAFAAACSDDALLPCPSDIRTTVSISKASLRVGETATATTTALICGGTQSAVYEWRYRVEDTTVARVDSISGLITARTIGSTRLFARRATTPDFSTEGIATIDVVQ